MHPVFNIGLLYSYRENKIPDQLPVVPPLTIVNGQEEHEVQEILQSQSFHGSIRDGVRWRGLGPSQDTWEWAELLVNAQELVDKFHKRHTKAPRTAAAHRSDRSRGGASTQHCQT